MIVDTLAASGRYESGSPALARAFAFLRGVPADIPDGRHEIDGEHMYAMVMSYETKWLADSVHETHRRYTDVQFLLSGREAILFTPAERLSSSRGYRVEKDCELFAHSQAPARLVLRSGDFAVFFAGEGHKPGCALEDVAPVRKVVVKLAL